MLTSSSRTGQTTPLLTLEHPVTRAFNGAALRDQRRLAGVPASQLAAVVGRTEDAVWAWERGRTVPPVDVAATIADALHLHLDQLLTTSVMAVA
ncbi:helix-turn-helix domain-containing protein [Streptomyces fagopyri]|uniref:helix-turn-helix domain-containing protein n=1 Tax=Streptomyces fagopyri TaxID=2662397 RepID=UPI0037131B27